MATGGGTAVFGEDGAEPDPECGELGRTSWIRRPLTGDNEIPGGCEFEERWI